MHPDGRFFSLQFVLFSIVIHIIHQYYNTSFYYSIYLLNQDKLKAAQQYYQRYHTTWHIAKKVKYTYTYYY